MTWILVKNKKEEGRYSVLPESWENISNFYVLEKSNPEYLNKLGWYKIQEIREVNYDSSMYYGPGIESFDFENNIYIIEYPLYKFEVESKEEEFSRNRAFFMEFLREKRNQLIMESDWTQMPDVAEEHTQDWINTWKVYRKALRSLPNVYEEQFPEETNIETILFPEKPNVN